MDFFHAKLSTLKVKLSSKGLYDSRILILLLIASIGVSVFWNGAKIIQQNYELSQKAEKVRQENVVLELQNKNKEYQNAFLGTDEYAELTARRVFGKAAPGETVYIMPKEVALAALSAPDSTEEPEEVPTEKPSYQRNIEAWLAVYFSSGRQ